MFVCLCIYDLGIHLLIYNIISKNFSLFETNVRSTRFSGENGTFFFILIMV